MARTKKTIQTFEDSLSELENVIEKLERDDLTLDKALDHFERGIGLMRSCDTHLRDAHGKLRELLRGENGELVTKILGENLESFIDRNSDDE